MKESDNFFEKVYQVARLIPYGKVTSYGSIANYLGAARSARMVGWAMNNSHNQTKEVPAHRVVNRKVYSQENIILAELILCNNC